MRISLGVRRAFFETENCDSPGRGYDLPPGCYFGIILTCGEYAKTGHLSKGNMADKIVK